MLYWLPLRSYNIVSLISLFICLLFESSCVSLSSTLAESSLVVVVIIVRFPICVFVCVWIVSFSFDNNDDIDKYDRNDNTFWWSTGIVCTEDNCGGNEDDEDSDIDDGTIEK